MGYYRSSLIETLASALVWHWHRHLSPSPVRRLGSTHRQRQLNSHHPERASSSADGHAAWQLGCGYHHEASEGDPGTAAWRSKTAFWAEADVRSLVFVGKHLTRSTRFTCFCTAHTSVFQQISVKNCQKLPFWMPSPHLQVELRVK